ncbi:hypothetical protein DFS34DRAFT_42505 [Phlyctochytrium arcticum]|nr:hypothetical protein DFS34DRAFT_42505 [Phlyctochytrium arcticum]
MARRLQRTNRGSPQLPAPAEPPKVRRAAVTYGADKTIKSAAASSPARPNKRRIIYSSSDDDCDDLLAEPEELLRTVVKSPAIVIRPSAAKRKRPAKGKSAVTKRQTGSADFLLPERESEDDGADKCLKIPGEAVLAWHEMERKYYPAQILEYRGPNYQVEFLTSKKKCLPRDFFYTQYQEEFRTAPVRTLFRSGRRSFHRLNAFIEYS